MKTDNWVKKTKTSTTKIKPLWSKGVCNRASKDSSAALKALVLRLFFEKCKKFFCADYLERFLFLVPVIAQKPRLRLF